MPLPRRPFGRTDMEITRIGFGAWAAGGGDWAYSWGAQDDADSIAAITRAVELGINWIDTAAIYGLGHSEEVVGRALRNIPAGERPYVFTKGGLVWDPERRNVEPQRMGTPASVRREVEDSLKRLGLDCIDLYQMHWPANDAAIEDYWAEFLKLREEGKIRAAGLSNHDSALLARAQGIGHVDSLQPPFSMIRRSFAANELAWCREHHTGVIVYSPMQAGLLTGRFSLERVRALPPDDWRGRSAEFNGEKLSRNLALADSLKPIAERHGTSQATIALAWVLSWRGVSGAIVGARNPGQVDDWIAAASLDLTQQDLDEIAAAIERTGAGSGPRRPD